MMGTTTEYTTTEIEQCPECGADVEHYHANVLGDPVHHVWHRCTQCDWTDAPFTPPKHEPETPLYKCMDDPSEYGEPDDAEADTIPDTGEEDDIHTHTQQLQDMYTTGYSAGRIAGKLEALSEYMAVLGRINERIQKVKRP